MNNYSGTDCLLPQLYPLIRASTRRMSNGYNIFNRSHVRRCIPIYFLHGVFLGYGLDIDRFLEQMITSPISSFFVADLLFSVVVLWSFIFLEGRRLKMKNLWVYIFSFLLVGVSLTLPLFLYFREGIVETH